MREVDKQEELYGFEGRESDLRRVPAEDRNVNIQQLWQRSHEILRMALHGMKYKEIALILRITPTTVSNCLNSELGMAKLAEMRLQRDAESIDVAKEITKTYPHCVRVYNKILEDEENQHASLALQKATADTMIMDIGGHKAPTQIQGQHIHGILTGDQLERFKKRGKAAAKSAGLLVEGGEDGD